MASPVLIVSRETHGVVAREDRGFSPFAWPKHLLQIAGRYFVGCRYRLDLGETPDLVKRDLGFLDGHAPYREENRMR